MSSQSASVAAIGSKLIVIAILVASLIVVPQLTGSERAAGLVGSAGVAGLAALYARQRRDLIGLRWMWFSLAISLVWLVGFGVLLFVPLPPGGATAT